MRSLRRQIFGFFNTFPCPLCESGDGGGANLLCPECRKKLHLIRGEICPRCGGELNTMLGCCTQCLAEPERPWRRAISVWHYEGSVREMICRCKYGRRVEFLTFLGEALAEKIRQDGGSWDLIVPMPLYFLRRFERGFNQSEEIAKVVSRQSRIPLKLLLRRIRGGVHQAQLNRQQRRRNLTRLFRCPAETEVKGKRVLLIDDVFTTGSTLAGAASVLLRAGAAEVTAATLARTPARNRQSAFPA